MENISHIFKDQKALAAGYLPFVEGGAIFIPYFKLLKLHEDVAVEVKLDFTEETFNFNGKVVWITPTGSHKPAGVGILLNNEDAAPFRNKVRDLIATMDENEIGTAV